MIKLFLRSITNNNTNKIRPRLVWICIISVVGMYLGITNHTLVTFVLLLNVMSLVIFNTHEIFCELMFLLPFTAIYKLNPASTSFFTYLSLITVVRFFLTGYKIPRNILIAVLLFTVVTFDGIGNALNDFIKIISNILIFSAFVKTVRRDMFPNIILSLTAGEVVSSLIGLRKTTWPALAAFYTTLKEEHIGTEKIARFTGLYLDPNYYSILIICCLFGLLLFMYKKEIRFQVGFPLFIALLIFGCLTYSRLFYISLVMIIFIVILFRLRNGSILSTVILFFLFGSIFLFYATEFGIIENITFRFKADDITNNRINIWKNYLELIAKSDKILFFGSGLGSEDLNASGSHNFYIETIYYIGLLGGAIYYYIYYSILKKRVFPIFKRGILNWATTGVVLIMFSTLGMLFQFDFAYIFMIDWIFLNTNIRRE